MDTILNDLKLLFAAHYPFVYLISWEEDRVLRGLQTLATEPGRFAVWSATEGLVVAGAPALEGTRDPLACLGAIQAADSKRIFVLRDFHPYLEDPDIVRRMRDLASDLARRQKLVIILAPRLVLPPELEKDIEVIDMPLPKPSDVAALLQHVLKSQGIAMDTDTYERMVKASLGLTEMEIRRVYTRILVGGGRFGEEDLRLLINEKKRILRRNPFLEFLETPEKMEEIGGLGQLKEWLTIRGKAFSEKARRFGLPQPKGLFMLGVQGCGKSLTAKAVARSWRMPLIRLDVGSLVNGTDEDSSLRETIRIAESMSPVVLWIDEIEKAFTGAGGAKAEGNVTRIFGGLLTWLQEKAKPVFVIATANDIQNLPPELLRKGRFDEIFFIDLPNVHEREAILEIHLKKRDRDPKLFDCYSVSEATEKFSGAELEQLVIAGLFTAFSKGRELTTRDLLLVARETVPLAVTMDTRIKALKDWARNRTRPAAWDTRRVDFFEDWEEVV